MDIKKGDFFFIKEEFFNLADDNFLKKEKEETKRPHYFALTDKKDDSIIWAVPISSKIEKFERIVSNKEAKGNKRDGIQFAEVKGKKTAFLFQDMFPITREFIEKPYMAKGQIVKIDSQKRLEYFEKIGNLVSGMVSRGIKLVPTAIDVKKIKNILKEQEEQKKSVTISSNSMIDKIDEKINNYQKGISELEKAKKTIIEKKQEVTINNRTKEAKKKPQENTTNIPNSKGKSNPEL